MAKYGKYIDGAIEYAPKNYKRNDGSIILNFAENKDLALAYGYKEVIENIPKYDEKSEALILTDCSETTTTITPIYDVVKIETLLTYDDMEEELLLKIVQQELLNSRLEINGEKTKSLSDTLKKMLNYFSLSEIYTGDELPLEGNYKIAFISEKPKDDGSNDEIGDVDTNYEITDPNRDSAVLGDVKKIMFVPYYDSSITQGYPDELVAVTTKDSYVNKFVEVKNTNSLLDNIKFKINKKVNLSSLTSNTIPSDMEVIGIACKSESIKNSLSIYTGTNCPIGKLISKSSATATVTVNNLNVRTGADTTYESLGVVNAGYIFVILETYQNSNWVKVWYNGQEAYAYCSPEYTNRGTLQLDANGNPVYGYGSNNVGSLSLPARGVDVSKHQGTIDWNLLKENGVKFAILRIGYGSRVANGGVIDEQFKANVQGCIKNGIPFGAYFFSYASSLDKLKAEAQWVIDTLAEYKGVMTFPIFFDQEYASLETSWNGSKYISVNPGKATLTNYMNTFCSMMSNAGWATGIYSNRNWLTSYVNFDEVKGWDLWFANPKASAPNWTNSDVKIWQYSWELTFGNSSTPYDGNYCYVDYPTLIKNSHKNGF